VTYFRNNRLLPDRQFCIQDGNGRVQGLFIDYQFIAVGSSVRCPTGFGPWTDSVPPVHCRLAAASLFVTIFILVFTQTTQRQTYYRNACPSALMRCRCGWLLTDYCSTPPRLRCCGAHMLDVNTRSQLDQYASATRQTDRLWFCVLH